MSSPRLPTSAYVVIRVATGEGHSLHQVNEFQMEKHWQNEMEIAKEL